MANKIKFSDLSDIFKDSSFQTFLTKNSLNLTPSDLKQLSNDPQISQIITHLQKFNAALQIIINNSSVSNEADVLVTTGLYLNTLRELLTGEKLIFRIGGETEDGHLQVTEYDSGLLIQKGTGSIFEQKNQVVGKIDYELTVLNNGFKMVIEDTVWQKFKQWGFPEADKKQYTAVGRRLKSQSTGKLNSMYQNKDTDTYVYKAWSVQTKKPINGWYYYTGSMRKLPPGESTKKLTYYNQGWIFEWLESYILQRQNTTGRTIDKIVNRLDQLMTKNKQHPISVFLKITHHFGFHNDNDAYLTGGDYDIYQMKFYNQKIISLHQVKTANIDLIDAFQQLQFSTKTRLTQADAEGKLFSKIFTNKSNQNLLEKQIIKQLNNLIKSRA